jgi:hypothetical protein
MKAYSRILAQRALSMVLILILTIGLAMYWQSTQVAQPDHSVYRPAQRIAQVLAADLAIRQATGPSVTEPQVVLPPCDGRALKVLRTRLVASSKVPAEEVDERISQAARSLPHWPGCASFVQAFDLAIAMTSPTPDAPGLSQRRVEQALTEDVNWTRRLPCLLGRDGSKARLLTGSALVCADAAPELDSLTSMPRDSSYRHLAALTARAVSTSAVAGQLNIDSIGWLSLSPTIHAVMDQWHSCRQAGSCPQLKALTAQRDVSLVLMDAKSGLILAAWCDGRACTELGRQATSSWPATLVEAPPASTAKLMFSLELAQAQLVEPLVLQRQIKTSGQNDGRVTKRNEWWERQAICDPQQNPSCDVPAKTRLIADAIGFNVACEQSAATCGRWGLVQKEIPALSPGTVGRIALERPTGKPVRMLDWNTYELVRQGKLSQRGLKGFEPASRAIQAVLGAGDSRTSALGLAVLSTQIWRMSEGLPLLAPRAADFGTGVAVTGDKAPRRLQAAAITVLDGMRKVVEPPEPAWQGAGTVAGAFEWTFGRSCKSNCGVWAKTGTVSQQDKVYGGTTLLTALVDVQALGQWAEATPLLSDTGPMLALGVIAMPAPGAGEGHAASQIGMGLVRELLSGFTKP